MSTATQKKTPDLTPEQVLTLTLTDILCVYSGTGGCNCGCKGHYRYNSAYMAEGSKDRGYDVHADEVNDKQIKKVLGLVQEAVKAGNPTVDFGESYVSMKVGERNYVVYPREVTLKALREVEFPVLPAYTGIRGARLGLIPQA